MIRFKNPLEGAVTWDDLVKGTVSVSNDELDDLVLLRADGVPTYNFGVVVDDLDMAMTHVIRGDDHVNNTPRQINLYRALGGEVPHFAHMPMILGADGQRLSKRHGAVSVLQYRDEGFLPEALVNYLARLGWSHGDEEMFSREQLVEWFDLEHVSRSPARWDPEKLKWLNGEYLKRIPAGGARRGHPRAQPRAARRDRRGHGPRRDDRGGAGQLVARERARGLPARAGLARDHRHRAVVEQYLDAKGRGDRRRARRGARDRRVERGGA